MAPKKGSVYGRNKAPPRKRRGRKHSKISPKNAQTKKTKRIMQAITDTIAGKYWWVLAIAGAAIALGLVLWRMPSIRASFAAMRCGKPAPPKRRVVEAESEYETDSDAGEISEGRLLAHMPRAPVEAVETVEAVEAAEAAPRRRGRPGRKKAEVTRECTE